MINIFLFLAFIFTATFVFGRLIEKLKVPWIFGALLLGFLLSIKNPFAQIVSSESFRFLADLGLYLLLFVIGFEIDLKAIFREGKFIIKSTLFIILFEAFFGSVLIHYLFGLSWLISSIVALSFATVGEAILIPILDEFKLLGTSLGRAIIGVGTLDDAFEIFTLVLAVLVIGAGSSHFSVFHVVSSLLILLALTFTFQLFGKETRTFKFFNVETLFFFSLIILFFFVGVGEYAEAASLGALFAGISLKTYLPEKRYKSIAGIVKAICYGFFAPIFFLDVGVNMNMNYLLTAPGIIILIVLITFIAKLVASYVAAHGHFGFKDSMLLGVGLSVRFSTSMVIVKILLDSGVITNELFSIIIASSAIFTFIIPILFSHLLIKWHLSKQ